HSVRVALLDRDAARDQDEEPGRTLTGLLEEIARAEAARFAETCHTLHVVRVEDGKQILVPQRRDLVASHSVNRFALAGLGARAIACEAGHAHLDLRASRLHLPAPLAASSNSPPAIAMSFRNITASAGSAKLWWNASAATIE